ncbi:MAG: hypothetical protein LBF08_04675 [Dysgonamonadaceae bacterium]|jgi:hypothetical protein|nr:hypothetical protein [Dysgonamonadaceae bacterium]
MKHFFKKLSLLSLLFVVIVLFLTLLLSVSLQSKKDDSFMAFFVKQEMLANKHRQKTPAVILLGGSNVAYGFNSEMLRDSLDMPAINAAVSRGLGLKFMMDHTSKYLTKGDILVIAPEYHHFFGDCAYGEALLANLFYIDPSISEDFNIKQIKALIIDTKNLLRDYLTSFLGLQSKNFTFKVSDYNRYGDMAAHWTMPPRPYSHASSTDFQAINKNFLDYYENAVKSLRNKGVKVVIIPPSFAETSYSNVEEKLLPLFSEFARRDLDFAIPPQEFAYPDSLFFDTHYHLGYAGIVLRTNRLINLMRAR